MKTGRHNKIMEIIETCDIETQEELIDHLVSEGYKVTQATVSRDIREMKLAKVMCENGKYRYVVPQTAQESDGHHVYTNALSASITGIDFAGNIIVVKTYPGLANAVAVGLESLRGHDILGCVAGDDTVIAVARDGDIATAMVKKLKKTIVE